MEVLITGGLGYLGSMVIAKLLEHPDVRIVCVDKGVYGVEHVSTLMLNRRLKISIGDIRDKAFMKPLVKRADTVIHLAALVGAPLVQRKKIEAKDVNIDGTQILGSLLSTNQKILFASTGSTYGKVPGICDESTPISPLSEYGVHKSEGEAILGPKGSINMRFATVYGLSYRTRNDLYINNMIKKALLDRSVVLYEGKARRTFAHVVDIARAVVFLVMQSQFTSGPINIGDSRLSYTKEQICKEIEKLTEFTVVDNQFAKDIDQRDYEVSYELFENLGFEFEVNFRESLNVILDYYKATMDISYENG